eukprot:TRINITY_DN231_c0_g1_i2.p1 TRINITY_DN231_c0_g1~~TRINITY_DN231_c0_g1_i2.p1  ORF type:complete len:236 (-),score=42.79 TRINITY_DN231_c0_g1_i2:72-674(-)
MAHTMAGDTLPERKPEMLNKGDMEDSIKATVLLKSDHGKILTLFSEWKTAKDQRCKELGTKIITELYTHSVIEETVFYPTLRLLVSPDKIKEYVDDHQTVNEMLDELRYLEPSVEGYNKLRQNLMKEVIEHQTKEESTLFPILDNNLNDKQLITMGWLLEQCKIMHQRRGAARSGKEKNRLAEPLSKFMESLQEVAAGST